MGNTDQFREPCNNRQLPLKLFLLKTWTRKIDLNLGWDYAILNYHLNQRNEKYRSDLT